MNLTKIDLNLFNIFDVIYTERNLTKAYFDMLKDQGYLFAGAPTYPFHAQLREATAPILYDILTGKIESNKGMDMMAEKAEEELTSLGYRK